jgi:hypothetical protein
VSAVLVTVNVAASAAGANMTVAPSAAPAPTAAFLASLPLRFCSELS